MKSSRLPGIKQEQDNRRCGIPTDRFEDVKNGIERELRKKMRENEMREVHSIRYASDFVTTPPFGDE